MLVRFSLFQSLPLVLPVLPLLKNSQEQYGERAPFIKQRQNQCLLNPFLLHTSLEILGPLADLVSMFQMKTKTSREQRLWFLFL